MEDDEKTKDQLIEELRKLRKRLLELENRRAFTYEDELKLAIIDRAPFSLWACNREFKIVLWAGGCDRIYGHRSFEALGKNYLTLFVDEVERKQSAEDCISIIDDDVVFRNFLAYDQAQDGSRRTMLTNCFRIWDSVNEEYLQAEVAIEISDLELAVDRHRNLREAGVAYVEQRKRIFELEKRELRNRIMLAYPQKLSQLDAKKREVDGFIASLRRRVKGNVADSLTTDYQHQFQDASAKILSVCQQLLDRIEETTTVEECAKLVPDITEFETNDYSPSLK